jgi:hypothetical protein
MKQIYADKKQNYFFLKCRKNGIDNGKWIMEVERIINLDSITPAGRRSLVD